MNRHYSKIPDTPTDLSGLSAPDRRSMCASNVLRSASTDLAYVLGAWTAHTEVGTPRQRFLSFCSRRLHGFPPLIEALTVVSGEPPLMNPATIGEYSGRRIRCLCPLLSDHLHEITANNSRVPWEHLATPLEQQSYLRGLFDHGGWMSHGSSPGLGVNKTSGLHLLQDIGRVFFRLGIYPLVLGGELPSLRLRDRCDWVLFQEHIGFSALPDGRALRALCGREGSRRSYSVEEYQHVMRLHGQRQLSAQSISSATGVPQNTVRDWVERGQMPRVFRRFCELQATEDASPDPGVISLLFREYGASSELARRVSKRMGISKVLQALADCSAQSDAHLGDEPLARLLLTPARRRH